MKELSAIVLTSFMERASGIYDESPSAFNLIRFSIRNEMPVLVGFLIDHLCEQIKNEMGNSDHTQWLNNNSDYLSENYSGLYVAVDGVNGVVASGKTISDIVEQLKNINCSGPPVITFIPETGVGYVFTPFLVDESDL